MRQVHAACLLTVVCVAAACGPTTPEGVTQVSESSAGAYEASLATFADGFMAAWYDTRDGHGEIYARRLTQDGEPNGPELRLTNGAVDAYEADVVAAADGLIVGWYERAKDGRVTPKLGAWDREGSPRWTKTLAASGRNTVVRASRGLVFTAWVQDEADDRAGVWAAWWRTDGVGLTPPRRVADAGRTTWNLNATMDPDASPGQPRAWIAFDAKAGTRSEEVFVVEVDATTARVAQLTPNDGFASKYPDLAFGDSRIALTWFDAKDGNEEVYLAVGERGALRAPLASNAIRRVTTTAGASIGAYVAWNSTRVGLAWCDDTPGNQELYFQAFDSQGTPLGTAAQVTQTPASSSIPAIRAWRDGFAVLWNEYEAPAGDDGHAAGGRSQVMFTTLR